MGFINEGGTYFRKDNEFDNIFAQEPKKHKKYNYYDSCMAVETNAAEKEKQSEAVELNESNIDGIFEANSASNTEYDDCIEAKEIKIKTQKISAEESGEFDIFE